MSRIAALVIIISLMAAGAVLSDGMIFPVERRHSDVIVPDQLFTVRYHHVNVTINDQLCTTKVDQIFHNDASVDREGIYIFPMPEGSAITKFSMYAGEDEITGKVLDRGEARSIYESIVRQRKDPALLEYIDRNTFRASVYPIPAKGDKRIKLSYAEVASRTGNTFRYVYPLSTERFSAKPLEDCKVTIKIKCKRPITSVYSPTHQIEVDRVGATEATVTWSAKDVKPDTDMILYYSTSDDDIGIDLVAHRQSGEKGYYMLLASPRVAVDKTKVLPKNVVFVLDRTGSMAGGKLDQAKAALKFCLTKLNAGDKFNVVTFNESPTVLFEKLKKVDADARKKALDSVDSIESDGGTNINEALPRAIKLFQGADSSRNYLIFLTDGLPTVGVTDPEKILENVRAANKSRVKIFAFGVGYDVNTHLLDKLAEQSKGSTDYVRPREDIEVKVSTFFAKVSDPILSDVEVKISGVKTSDAFPSANIPDIFRGSQLIIFGRYDGSGDVKVELSGVSNGSRKTFVLRADLPSEEKGNEFIPQLWASRKIGYLLDEIRLHSNQELIDEVVRLSKLYGIPTEYTSFLADERKTDVALKDDLKRMKQAAKEASEVQSGSFGVAQSSNAQSKRDAAQSPAAMPAPSTGGGVQVIGNVAANGRVGGTYQDAEDRTVVVANVQNIARRTFYQRGDYWEDADLKPDQKFVQIKQFSDAHFKLLKAYPKLAQFSTLGNLRLILDNKQAVEIGPQGKDTMTAEEMKELLKGV